VEKLLVWTWFGLTGVFKMSDKTKKGIEMKEMYMETMELCLV